MASKLSMVAPSEMLSFVVLQSLKVQVLSLAEKGISALDQMIEQGMSAQRLTMFRPPGFGLMINGDSMASDGPGPCAFGLALGVSNSFNTRCQDCSSSFVLTFVIS